MGVALSCIPRAVKALGRDAALERLADVAAAPDAHGDDEYFAPVAQRLVADAREAARRFVEREAPAPLANYCEDAEAGALDQMRNSLRLPSALRGALMPDAHRGYGLPIGGVLETEGTVIPYAVGVDIACRMKLSVLDVEPEALDSGAALEQALLTQTQFGTGAKLRKRADHDAMHDERWRLTPLATRLRDKAADQLGTSGSGNHFVEFGLLTLPEADLGLPAGRYVALLSHSGSRGAGAQIASHYSKLARELHPELPKELSYLSWLDLDHDSGREYLQLMRLMGEYASACHAVIHERVTGHLKAEVLAGVENHHNFAWTAERDGREVVVHRKGATPAAAGELGVIPGSMAAPGFVVRGKGAPDSIESASHGAGRRMSRTAATQQFNWQMVRPLLRERGVKVLSAGIDENPFAYKDIEAVMAAQTDLVDVIARFDPRIVRMADAGERPED
ncbi:RtcB family protein [Solirubrobacter sp. CPCC 204708]|nr:RtcB family protein [Solirubrobacter deserti]